MKAVVASGSGCPEVLVAQDVGKPSARWDSRIGRHAVATTSEGGYAQQARAGIGHLVPIPDGPGAEEVAALPRDGRTAMGLMDSTGVRLGEWALITGAGGGLGSLLMQLARAAGMIEAARRPAGLEHARTAAPRRGPGREASPPASSPPASSPPASSTRHSMRLVPRRFLC
ncbi:hypothetical protein OIE63_01680 [Streptomyces sp. NBC_01795]|uniref:hypothetical protein n=1 Tax=unclassified Streptomyces TaxID=2593676 RepID=UPI002DDBD243|nr:MULTISPECIES: hypothetical protein [unclassified Streptomyces]WSA90381.1 hypothetical protein OIE63_01680 [Streptomyces sp. NBC_01795]WSB74607.1 hypothetical protein OHB04_01675 [Streptomyces sp. NBC_01775]